MARRRVSCSEGTPMRDLHRLIFGIVSFSIFLATPALGQTGSNSADAVWRSFRTAYPYHIQCIGLTEPDSDGTRVLLIAEPPPQVSLRALSPSRLQHPIVKRQTVGYDGWVADVLYVLPQMSGGSEGTSRQSKPSSVRHLPQVRDYGFASEQRGYREEEPEPQDSSGGSGRMGSGRSGVCRPGTQHSKPTWSDSFRTFFACIPEKLFRASRTRRQVFAFVFF
jgi:hypothetical protein